jgi:hypothetical protein
MGRADRRGVEQRSSPSGWLSPDLLILLALVATTAGWATRARLLSGVGLGIAGSVVQATVWLFVYAALGRVYRGAATASGLERGVLRRLGCALLLGFMSAAISKQIMNPLLAPLTWYDFWFVRQLVVPVFVGIWCVALLPGETRRLVRAAGTHPAVAPFPQLALFGAAAAVLVSCTDLAFQFADWSGPEALIATDQITPMAWVTNTLLLFSAFALVFAVTARVGIALVAVGSLYTGWAVVNQVKLQYMHVPVQPLDVILIPELLPLIPRFFGGEALVGVVAAVTICIGVLVIGARLPACRMSRSDEW